METKILQISGIPAKVLKKAKKRAISEGFSSVQDIVRIFLFNYSEGRIRISLTTKSPEKPLVINHLK